MLRTYRAAHRHAKASESDLHGHAALRVRPEIGSWLCCNDDRQQARARLLATPSLKLRPPPNQRLLPPSIPRRHIPRTFAFRDLLKPVCPPRRVVSCHARNQHDVWSTRTASIPGRLRPRSASRARIARRHRLAHRVSRRPMAQTTRLLEGRHSSLKRNAGAFVHGAARAPRRQSRHGANAHERLWRADAQSRRRGNAGASPRRRRALRWF